MARVVKLKDSLLSLSVKSVFVSRATGEQAWWYTTVNPALGRLRQEDQRSKLKTLEAHFHSPLSTIILFPY